MTKYPVTDFDVQALVDSQLDWEDEKRVLEAVRQNAVLQSRYHELLAQKKLLAAWWAEEESSLKEVSNHRQPVYCH